MAKKKTHEEFIKEISLINNNIEIIGEYKNSYTKIKCRCKIHDIIWDIRPDSLSKGAGCEECKKEKIGSKYRRTNEEFVSLLKKSNPNIKPLEKYINNNTKIRCLCLICNHEWNVRPNELLAGKQCTNCSGYKKKTTDEFKEEIKQLTDNEYIVLGDYINSSTKILFKHNIESCGHKWYTKPNTFLNGSRCPKCAKENNAKNAKNRVKRKTHEQFLKEVSDLVNDEYSVISNYISAKEKITFLHNACGHEFFISPSSFLKGQRCPLCTKLNIKSEKSKGIEKFRQEIFDLVGDEYILVDTEYINAHTKMKFIHNNKECKKEFLMTPNTFLRGNRCPHCRYIKNGINLRKTQEQFETEVKNLKGDEYTVLEKYEKCDIKIKMRHNKCGRDFDIFPSWFLQGYGCTHCTNEEILKNKTKSQEKFKSEIRELTNGEYSIIGKYINAKTNVKMMHNYCGTLFDVKPTMFLSAKARCPICTTNSNGEVTIRQYLNSVNINYDVHKTFPDLFGTGGGYLSYDFYIPSFNMLIEYQGKQHDTPIEYFGGERQFKIQQIHDDIKRSYAKNHNIKLLEIWYWDFDNIENILQKELNIEELVG